MAIRMRHCCFCDAALGEIDDKHYHRSDTCGRRECERFVREEIREEIEAERDERRRQIYEDYRFGRL